MNLNRTIAIPKEIDDSQTDWRIWSSTGRFFAASCLDGSLKVWDRSKGSIVQLRGPAASPKITGIGFSEDESTFLATYDARVTEVNSTETWGLVETLLWPQRAEVQGHWITHDESRRFWHSHQSWLSPFAAKVNPWLKKLGWKTLHPVISSTLIWDARDESPRRPAFELPGELRLLKDGRLATIDGTCFSIWSLPPARPWLRSAVAGLGAAAAWLALERLWAWRRQRVQTTAKASVAA